VSWYSFEIGIMLWIWNLLLESYMHWNHSRMSIAYNEDFISVRNDWNHQFLNAVLMENQCVKWVLFTWANYHHPSLS
jgi:hypothetical protein